MTKIPNHPSFCVNIITVGYSGAGSQAKRKVPVIIFGEMGHRGINTEKCVIRTFLGCLILFTRISWLSDNMIIPPVTVGYAQEAFGSFKNRRHKMAG